MKDSQSGGHTFLFNCKEIGSLEVSLCILMKLGCILSTLSEILKHIQELFGCTEG